MVAHDGGRHAGMSDDIPVIFTEELRRGERGAAPVAVFGSAMSAPQMQQYATAGWTVIAPPSFRSPGTIALTEVPARSLPEEEIPACTLLSCEAPFLDAPFAERIARWRPAFVKINCAFHDIADAAALGRALAGAGYRVAAALWRDDNSFGHCSLAAVGPLASFPAVEWDRANLIGVLDPDAAQTLLTVARLYVGEERRIADLHVANRIRNDHIARLEDALMAHQTAAAVIPPRP